MRKLQTNIPSRTAGNDGQQVLGSAPHASTVVAALFTPEAAITGANTNTRRIAIVNKGKNGTGNTEIAAIQFDAGTDAPDAKRKTLALAATHASRRVARGDVLKVVSTHIGTGIADPGGLVQVEIR